MTFESVDCRIESSVAAVAASVDVLGNPDDDGEVLDFSSGDVAAVVDMTFRDCNTARDDRSDAIVDANA